MRITKWIIVLVAACISYTASASVDDDKKPTKKSTSKFGNFKFGFAKGQKTRKQDTLIYNKTLDDTLTFDDEKTSDDTLIFADDEINFKDKSKNKNTEFSVRSSDETMVFNPAIYPNPCYGQTVIDLTTTKNSLTEITITSIQGVLILKVKTTNNTYELIDMAVGSYVVTICNGSRIIQKRLFVKR